MIERTRGWNFSSGEMQWHRRVTILSGLFITRFTVSCYWILADFLNLVHVRLYSVFSKNNDSCAMSLAALLRRVTTHRREIRAGSLPHCLEAVAVHVKRAPHSWLRNIILQSSLKQPTATHADLLPISEGPLARVILPKLCQREKNTHSTSG